MARRTEGVVARAGGLEVSLFPHADRWVVNLKNDNDRTLMWAGSYPSREDALVRAIDLWPQWCEEACVPFLHMNRGRAALQRRLKDIHRTSPVARSKDEARAIREALVQMQQTLDTLVVACDRIIDTD